MKSHLVLLVALAVCAEFSRCSSATTKVSRPFVIKDLIAKSGVMSFYTDVNGGVLLSTQVTDGQAWSPWVSLGVIGTGIKAISSPVGVHTSTNQTRVFVMASDGQVYSSLQTSAQQTKIQVGWRRMSGFVKGKVGPLFGKWVVVGNSSLPHDEGVVVSGLDSVSVGNWNKAKILVFARSMTNESSLYWAKGDEMGDFSAWTRIGNGKPHLATDATVIYNPFSGYYEAFAVMKDGKLNRAWQKNGDGWSDWRSMGKCPIIFILCAFIIIII